MKTDRNTIAVAGIPWGAAMRRLVRAAGRDCRAALHDCRRRMDPRSVHRLRVALRRFEARLLIVEAVAGTSGVARVRAAVKRRLAALGKLRDAQVHGERMEEMHARHGGLKGLRARWRRRERRLQRTAARRLRPGRLGRRVERLLGILRVLPGGAGADRRRQARVERMLHRLEARSRARQPRTVADLAGLHRARIAFKRYHLAAEALQPFLPGLGAAQLEWMKSYQRLMGEIHDLDLLVARLDRAVRQGRVAAGSVRAARASLSRRRASRVKRYLGMTREFVGARDPE